MCPAVNSEQFVSELSYTAADMSHGKIARYRTGCTVLSVNNGCFCFFQVWDDDEVLEQRAGEEAFFPGSEWNCSFFAALQLQEGESPCDFLRPQTFLNS